MTLLLLNELWAVRPNVFRETVKERMLEAALQSRPFALVVVAPFVEIDIIEPTEVEQVVALAETSQAG